ncbi:MAG: histidine phosphatase family protein [Balneolaceae bacterium]|nr:histidine phosphatase family protein [Balneolaceae bacterium]
MSAKHFYLIRHGETDYNKSLKLQGRGIDASLNEQGRMQADCVAEALQEVAISQIITSSLKRAQESAEPLSRQRGIEYQSFSELDEMDFGDWEGQLFDDVVDEIRETQSQWKAGNTATKVPGGESPEEVFQRSGSKLKEIAAQTGHEHTAVIIHGRLIRILLAGMLDYGLENMHQIKHQNGSINHIVWKDGAFEAVQLNRVDHLPKSELVWNK